MLQVIDKIFNIFATPSVVGLAAMVASLLFLLAGLRRLGIAVLATATLVGVGIYSLPVEDWLLVPLESRFPKPAILPVCIQGILMIGGGEDRGVTKVWGEPTLATDFGSFVEATRLMRTHPETTLLFSGYGNDAGAVPTEAEVARQVLVEMGVDPSRIKLEQRSRDTWQNFVFSKVIAQPKPGDEWVLVTASAHIPRSMGIAQHLGWHMIADPAYYLSQPSSPSEHLIGFTRRLEYIHTALHEWIGLLGYRLEGRIDTLFPAPGPQSMPQKSKSPQCMRAA